MHIRLDTHILYAIWFVYRFQMLIQISSADSLITLPFMMLRHESLEGIIYITVQLLEHRLPHIICLFLIIHHVSTRCCFWCESMDMVYVTESFL